MLMLMLQQRVWSHRTWRLSLSVRTSLLLILTAVLPLTIVTISSEALARPALVAQSTSELETDAQTHVELIEAYFIERLMDVATLTNYAPIQGFMAGNGALRTDALNGLITSLHRDANYQTWSLFDLQGHLLLDYPTPPPAAKLQFLHPGDRATSDRFWGTIISPVFFDPTNGTAAIMLYTPVITATSKPLGFICAVFQLNNVWNILNSEWGANGTGSYAFILDQNGVRIADTEPLRLFSSIAPLPSANSRDKAREAYYGTTIPVLADSMLARIQQSTQPPTAFQAVPYGQHELFQVARYPLLHVPWTYFVLSPLSTVTVVADQQLLTSSLIACLVLLMAALAGLAIGQQLTSPILRSVEYLRSNSRALNTLAEKQQSILKEQTWMVDSSMVGLQEMQHQTETTYREAQRLREISANLTWYWNKTDVKDRQHALEQITTGMSHIEQAVRSQKRVSQNLAIALKVTTQVTEQLAVGAISATDAAKQLGQVVDQLRLIVGKRDSAS
jgi:Cache domain